MINKLKKKYNKGTRVELVKMDDLQAPPIGTLGTVRGVDAIGSVLVDWDNGSKLNVVMNEDIIKFAPLSDCIINQISAIRDSGRVNMLDSNSVQVIANKLQYYQLVVFIEEQKERYFDFILRGE